MKIQDICAMLDMVSPEKESKKMAPSNGKDYALEIELIKKDVSSISKLHEKMDNTIDKIKDAANDISRVVFQQDQKIKQQENINKDMKEKFEKHTAESEEQSRILNDKIECVDDKIDRVNRELTDKIYQSQNIILTEMLQGREQLKSEISKINENVGKKISDIDAWRYMIMGGIALAVFIISNLIGLAKLFR